MINRIMLDSGAYSAFSGQVKGLTVERYIEFLLAHQKELKGVACVALDVIGDAEGSLKNFRKMQKAGLDVIPTYHVGETTDYLETYIAECKFIGIGGMANLGQAPRIAFLDRIWGKYLCDPKGMPRVKVHGFGMTDWRLVQRFPWWSVDSTAALMNAASANVYIPERRANGKWAYEQIPTQISISRTSPTGWGSYSTDVRAAVVAYCKEHGFRIGHLDKPKEGGVFHDYRERFALNIYTIQRWVNTLPKWPWAMKVTRRRLLT